MTKDYIRVLLFVLLVMTLVGALCIIFVPAHASPSQVPYVCGVSAGKISVCAPMRPGYDSGYVVVLNANTRERQAIYLTWQADHPLDMGLFESDPIQLVLMGSGMYIIEYGYLGIQEIQIDSWWQVFGFQVWRLWAPAVVR